MSSRFPVVPGFRASGIHSGIKARAPDLALIVSDVPATVAGVFTRSTVVSAPVELCRERVRAGRTRAVVVNSGCANVGLGDRGRAIAATMARLAARAVGCDEREVLVASTGVIGQAIPCAALRRGIPLAAKALSPRGFPAAARAILTTDRIPKLAVRRTRLGGRLVTVAGIAKGSGMIQPDMATLLAFVVTDTAVTPAVLRRLLREAAEDTLNRVTIDGETSTSDTALLLANGVAGNPRIDSSASPAAGRLARALREVLEDLARAVARDGEGATHLVTVRVGGARNPAEALRAARRIANSPLVKTAIFGADPNWGRILQTVGAARVAIDLGRAEVRLAGVPMYRRGVVAGPAARRRAAAGLRRPEVEIRVDLAAGRGAARVFTCDFSYDYVRINAEYTT